MDSDSSSSSEGTQMTPDFGGLVTGFLGGLGGGAVTGGGGRGRMAARGVAQAGIKIAQRAAIAAAQRFAFSDARERASLPGAFSAFEHPYAVVTPGASKEVIDLGVKIHSAIQAAQAAHGVRQQARAEREVTALQAKRAAKQALLVPQVTYAAEYGIANGLPVRGSRDDPNGIIYPRVTTSLLGG